MPNTKSIARACGQSVIHAFLLASSLVVHEAWVRETLAAGGTSAVYLTVENPTAEPITITGITAAGATRAEMHQMTGSADRATMRRAETLVVPAHGSLALTPGGTHVMLFGVDPAYAVGQAVTLTLALDHHPPQTAQAVVRPLGATAIR